MKVFKIILFLGFTIFCLTKLGAGIQARRLTHEKINGTWSFNEPGPAEEMVLRRITFKNGRFTQTAHHRGTLVGSSSGHYGIESKSVYCTQDADPKGPVCAQRWDWENGKLFVKGMHGMEGPFSPQ